MDPKQMLNMLKGLQNTNEDSKNSIQKTPEKQDKCSKSQNSVQEKTPEKQEKCLEPQNPTQKETPQNQEIFSLNDKNDRVPCPITCCGFPPAKSQESTSKHFKKHHINNRKERKCPGHNCKFFVLEGAEITLIQHINNSHPNESQKLKLSLKQQICEADKDDDLDIAKLEIFAELYPNKIRIDKDFAEIFKLRAGDSKNYVKKLIKESKTRQMKNKNLKRVMARRLYEKNSGAIDRKLGKIKTKTDVEEEREKISAAYSLTEFAKTYSNSKPRFQSFQPAQSTPKKLQDNSSDSSQLSTISVVSRMRILSDYPSSDDSISEIDENTSILKMADGSNDEGKAISEVGDLGDSKEGSGLEGLAVGKMSSGMREFASEEMVGETGKVDADEAGLGARRDSFPNDVESKNNIVEDKGNSKIKTNLKNDDANKSIVRLLNEWKNQHGQKRKRPSSSDQNKNQSDSGPKDHRTTPTHNEEKENLAPETLPDATHTKPSGSNFGNSNNNNNNNNNYQTILANLGANPLPAIVTIPPPQIIQSFTVNQILVIRDALSGLLSAIRSGNMQKILEKSTELNLLVHARKTQVWLPADQAHLRQYIMQWMPLPISVRLDKTLRDEILNLLQAVSGDQPNLANLASERVKSIYNIIKKLITSTGKTELDINEQATKFTLNVFELTYISKRIANTFLSCKVNIDLFYNAFERNKNLPILLFNPVNNFPVVNPNTTQASLPTQKRLPFKPRF